MFKLFSHKKNTILVHTLFLSFAPIAYCSILRINKNISISIKNHGLLLIYFPSCFHRIKWYDLQTLSSNYNNRYVISTMKYSKLKHFKKLVSNTLYYIFIFLHYYWNEYKRRVFCTIRGISVVLRYRLGNILFTRCLLSEFPDVDLHLVSNMW